PAYLDLRIAKIHHITPHPTREKLYLSALAVGDPPNHPLHLAAQKVFADLGITVPDGVESYRSVVSGLREFYGLEQLRGRRVVAVCNLKAVKLGGVESTAMVLAADNSEGEKAPTKVELVSPPEGSVGSGVEFEGYELPAGAGGRPEVIKGKKYWEHLVGGLRTDGEGRVVFDGERVGAEGFREHKMEGQRKLGRAGGWCRVETLVNSAVH
ncbi:nucleic acid-binding protein, partial [Ascobolus immersus RN42]